MRRSLLLVRNPSFRQWSAEAQPAGYPDRIQYRFGVTPSAGTSAVETGRADFTLEAPPAERLREIATRFSSLAHPYVQPSSYFMSLNTRIPPFNDVRVRRALNFATDRRKLVELWGGGELARPTCQVLPPGIRRLSALLSLYRGSDPRRTLAPARRCRSARNDRRNHGALTGIPAIRRNPAPTPPPRGGVRRRSFEKTAH
ncbi:MAG: hypothetical protein H0W90_16140 [Actinobacteria bacterium]|nr:hypothetical protein [Actinomycetota bacterium]